MRGVGLDIVSNDQRRIEALCNQILAVAAAGGHRFQITAYAPATDQANRFVADLESDVVDLILE